CSNAFSEPNRWLPNTPSDSVTRGLTSRSAPMRAAAPRIVSPSRKGLRNSVLSPYKRTSARGVTCSCATAAPPSVAAHATSATDRLPRSRMPHTISQRALALCIVLLIAARARAQTAPPAAEDPFAAHRWHVEGAVHAASEAWNYNGSHEELYGISEGLTYGVREGLVLTLNQRVYYLSQRANDTWVLGVTFGIRGRVYRRGRTSAFLEGNVGISDAAIAAPPRGTRFNYLAFGSGGVLVRVKPRIHLLAALQLIHIS